MTESTTPDRALAARLAAVDDPRAVLPAVLPCSPLELLIALHEETLSSFLSDLAHAGRAAAAAWFVAEQYRDDPLLRAQAHWTQGSALFFVPDYMRALQHYDQALREYQHACEWYAPAEPPRDIRIVQIVRVVCLTGLGRYVEAFQAVEEAERWLQAHPNDYARLTLLLNRCVLASTMDDHARVLELSEATIALATQLDIPPRVAHAWINRAQAFTALGHFEEAETALEYGLAALDQVEEPINVARVHLNRAFLYRCQGRLFEALTALREAQRGFAQAEGEAASVAMDAAAIYEQLRQLPEAQRAARYAADQYAQLGMPVFSAMSAVQGTRIAVQQQQLGNARKFLQMAREQLQQIEQPALHAEIDLMDAFLATLPVPSRSPKSLQRQYRNALRQAQDAVAVLQGHGLVVQVAEGRLIVAMLERLLGHIDSAQAVYRSLLQHANLHVRMAANAGLGDILPLKEALPYLQQAAMLSVEQRRALPMEELQARYSSETSPYHMRLAACLLSLGQPEQALAYVWEAKAGPLLDLRAAMSDLGPETTSMLTVAKAHIVRWRNQEQEHRMQAFHAAQQAQGEVAAYHTERARSAARELELSEQTLTAALRTLGDRGGRASVPTLDQFQQTLLPGMALLEYAQWGDALVCFFVRSVGPPLVRLLGPYLACAPLLDRWNLVCRRLMEHPDQTTVEQQIRAALSELGSLLLEPWKELLAPIKKLLIAPCGMLHHVPWAALWMSDCQFGEGLEVSLVPGGAMWATIFECPPSALGPPRFLSYAGAGTQRLAHVDAEVSAIARCFPDAQVYQMATAQDLRAAPAPRLLHVAAHGHTNPGAPLCSTLELADGPFLLLEAHRLDLVGTELVVLSACETSVRPDHGDMALALAGAFLCAGAHAVLASLWPVSDAATAVLMGHFYSALAGGADASAALQHAQYQTRKQFPLDWMAFQLWVGGHTPVD